jgi:type IV secretory pathway VirB2 component (pilin)
MKKTNNPFKIFLAILVVAVIGASLVEGAERIFGVVNVFIFAVAVVFVVGVIIVPIMQLKNRKA